MENLLKAGDVARILNVHLLSVYRFVYRGQLKCVKVGGTVRFRPEDVQAFIKDRPRPEGDSA
ncbi:MAG: helix-turn-helix domain-containing protein [candidate division NC10 bacterium]|nr:helix-turn-helix domain-containing protein [candidate division NC10 bacterium]